MLDLLKFFEIYFAFTFLLKVIPISQWLIKISQELKEIE